VEIVLMKRVSRITNTAKPNNLWRTPGIAGLSREKIYGDK
jgi:hypothetical protein